MHITRVPAIITALLATITLASCSQQEIEDSLQKGGNFVAQRAAVTAAEALRVTLISKANETGVSPERIELVAKVAASLPGVEILVVDANNDGLDDDGKVTVSSLGAVACLSLPTLSSKGSATAGAC